MIANITSKTMDMIVKGMIPIKVFFKRFVKNANSYYSLIQKKLLKKTIRIDIMGPTFMTKEFSYSVWFIQMRKMFRALNGKCAG